MIPKFYYYHSALTGVKKTLMMIVGGFIYRDPINEIHQKISFLLENEWNIYLSMKGLQESKETEQEPEYWNMKVHESRAKRPKICTEPKDDAMVSGDLVIDEMTAEGKKDKLKGRGFTTRLRSIKKLQELFLNTLREEKKTNSISLQ